MKKLVSFFAFSVALVLHFDTFNARLIRIADIENMDNHKAMILPQDRAYIPVYLMDPYTQKVESVFLLEKSNLG